jgi:TonB family protein
MQTSEPSLIARHAVIFAILALMGANAAAQKSADPGATELYVIPGAGKNRLPVGDCPAPSWPREAQRYEIEGVARIKYKLLPDGRVGEPRVIKSSGWAILDDATIALALSCRYTPQQAAEAQGREMPLEFAWYLEGERVYANMLPATCGPAGRIDGFQPFDRQPGDARAVKVRFLIDKTGTPCAVRIEGNDVDPALADEVIGYLGNCRFAYDPQARGVRTDTMYGRVLLR